MTTLTKFLLGSAFGPILLFYSPAIAGNWPTFAGSAQRLGVVTGETVLTPSSVPNLKLHWSTTVRATTQTQILFIEQVQTATHGTHDEVFQTGQDGSVVALNAGTGAIDWKTQLPTNAPPCVGGTLGIGGTPTIDPNSGRLYVVDGAGALHALHIGSGAEAGGYPIQVVDTTDVSNGSWNHTSPTLVGNLLYITTSAAGECEASRMPYHGAVIEFDTTSRTVVTSYLPVPDATGGGGIWGPGGAMADAATGNVFVGTGNAIERPSYAHDGESVVELSPGLAKLAITSPGPPLLKKAGDLDFGSTPTPIDLPNCQPQIAIMHKTGNLFLYQRDNLAAGPTQMWDISSGGGGSAFIGMSAYDPVAQMLFIDNPVPSRDGSITHGAVALQIASPACTFTVAWQSSFGSGTFSAHTRATDPVIAGGVVWLVTGEAKSVLAFNEVNGTKLWSSGDLFKAALVHPVTVADGQMFIQDNKKIYAFGL